MQWTPPQVATYPTIKSCSGLAAEKGIKATISSIVHFEDRRSPRLLLSFFALRFLSVAQGFGRRYTKTSRRSDLVLSGALCASPAAKNRCQSAVLVEAFSKTQKHDTPAASDRPRRRRLDDFSTARKGRSCDVVQGSQSRPRARARFLFSGYQIPRLTLRFAGARVQTLQWAEAGILARGGS
jgi:hypothetical protein